MRRPAQFPLRARAAPPTLLVQSHRIATISEGSKLMNETGGRRRFLRNMTAIGAAGGVSGAFVGEKAHATSAHPQMMAAASVQERGGSAPRGLPRIHLIVSAG